MMDRGYVDFDLFREIVEADSSFVIRMASNTVVETVEEIALTPEAEAAGVRSDRIVRMGWKGSRAKFDRPVRFVEVARFRVVQRFPDRAFHRAACTRAQPPQRGVLPPWW